MPSDARALTRAARERARHTGEPYKLAHKRLRADRAAPAAPAALARIVEGRRDTSLYLLDLVLTSAPGDPAGTSGQDGRDEGGRDQGGQQWTRTITINTPNQSPTTELADRLLAEASWIRTDEWRDALHADGAHTVLQRAASPRAARAHRESFLDTVIPERPCLCATYRLTGTRCDHGKPCPDDQKGEDGCGGRLFHADRYPGSLFELQTWEDVYACDGCGAAYASYITIPGLPWGERRPEPGVDEVGGPTIVFEGVPHPAFAEPDGCPDCGASPGYSCTCDTIDDDRCGECGGGGCYRCGCE